MPSLTQYSIKDSSLLIFLQGNRCWVWLLIDQTIAVEVECNHSKGVQCVFNHLVLFKCLQLVLLTQSCNYWSYWCYCLWRNCTVCFNLSLLLFLNTVFRQYLLQCHWSSLCYAMKLVAARKRVITQLYKSGVLFIISVSFLLTVYVAVSMVFSWLILIMFWSMTTLIRNIVFWSVFCIHYYIWLFHSHSISK